MGDLIHLHRIVELPLRTLDDIVRQHGAETSATDSGAAGGGCAPASRQLTRYALGDAVPARAATPSEPSLLRVSGIAGIAIAVAAALYFAAQMLRAVVS
jgi:hypothetical protein